MRALIFVAAVSSLRASLAAAEQPTGWDYCQPSIRSIQQPVNQFSYSGTATYAQRFLVCDKWFDPATAAPPVLLLYMGGEGGIERFYNDTSVLFSSIAPTMKALVVFLEHRYYGSSQPQPAADGGGRPKYDFMSIDQAMADTAAFLVNFQYLEEGSSPPQLPPQPFRTFLFGGSYGGMLVGWFRLKYPHLSAGGVISSGPLNFNPFVGRQALFWNATLHTYAKSSGTAACATAVTEALAAVQGTTDMDALLQGFQVCPFTKGGHSVAYVKKALDMYLKGALSTLAMVNYPYAWNLVVPLPARPVNLACRRLLQESPPSLAALNDVLSLYLGSDFGCRNIERELVFDEQASEMPPLVQSLRQQTSNADTMDMSSWNYQACTELPMEPLTTDFQGFFPPDDDFFVSGDFQRACEAAFPGTRIPGVYGRTGASGQMRNVVPTKFGLTAPQLDESVWQPLSHVVIVDHEYDPWRTGALDVSTPGGQVFDARLGIWRGSGASNEVYKIEPVPECAHHQDLIAEAPEDPPELISARQAILGVLQRWAQAGTVPQVSPQNQEHDVTVILS